MRGLRVNLAVLALLLLTPGAGAQSDSDATEAITSITLPDPEPEPGAKPIPGPDGNARPGAGKPADRVVPLAPSPGLPGRIDVVALGAVEGAPVGLLEGPHGLGPDLWAASMRADIETLMARTPLASSDPPLRDLSRLLVLTKAEAPPGPAKQALIGVRIGRLLQAGLIDEAGALAALARVPNDAVFARVQAEALLYAGREDALCGEATQERLRGGDTFWLELRATCAVLGGDGALADLTREVLSAQGGDRAFDVLLDDLMHGGKTLPALDRPSPVHIFLLGKLGLPVRGSARMSGTPAALLAVRDGRNPVAMRRAIAERIVSTGALSPGVLRALLDAEDGKTLADAERVAQNLPFLDGQALLRRAARQEPNPERRARLLYTALSLAERRGMLPLLSAVDADLLDALAPAPLDGASVFAKALILAGKPSAAARWKPSDARIQAALWITSIDPADGERWHVLLQSIAADLTKPRDPQAPPDERGAEKALILALAEALGRMPVDVKTRLAGVLPAPVAGKRPSDAVLARIDAMAFAPGGRGETLLLILDTIRAIGWRDLAPDVTAKFVRLVRSYGLNAIAAAMAREALIFHVAPPVPPPVPPSPQPAQP